MATEKTQLDALISPDIIEMGFDFWGSSLTQESGRLMLRIYIDKPTGITIDDCAQVTRHINGLLDVHDPIREKYILEVSSPGLERPLFEHRHYQSVIGQFIQVKLHALAAEKRHFSGTLELVDEENISLCVDEETIVLPFAAIEKANVEIIFQKPKKGVRRS